MENNPRPKRNSILKVRQEKNLLEMLDETTTKVDNGARRVSFHQMKHVKEYDRHLGKIIDATPTKEKAFDTISSDGTATPHATRTDMDITGSTRLFENTPGSSAHFANGTMDMSMDTTIENRPQQNETALLFDVTREKTVVVETTTVEVVKTMKTVMMHGGAPDDTMALLNMTNRDEVEMELDGVGAAARVDDTMAVFDTTNASHIDMDITQDQKPPVLLDDTMAVFRSPAPPRIQKTSAIQKASDGNSSSIDMDITRNSTISVPPQDCEYPMMDISGIQKTSDGEAMDITVAAAAAPDDTMEVFATPKTIQKTLGIQKEALDENDDAMDLETTLRMAGNETFDLLQSPARGGRIQKQKAQIQNLEVLEAEHVDMDITQREVEPSDDTMALFKSPEKIPAPTTTQIHQVFDDESMEIESTLRPEDVPEESPEDVKPSESSAMMSMATETSIIVVEENRCVSTMLQLSPFGRPETVEIQKTSTTASESQMSLSSSIQNSSVNVSRTEDVEDGASERSQIDVQTMMVDDADSLQNLTTKEGEGSEDMGDETRRSMSIYTQKEDHSVSRIQEEEDRSMNVSNVSRRRRSLLMDAMCRESPRRLAMENSMLSMSMAAAAATTFQGGAALAEYRQNKKMLNESVGSIGSAAGGNWNSTATTGRDIIQMNTSIRSPAHRPVGTHHNATIAASPDSTLQHVAPPPPKSPESFRLPHFDAAIVNVIYLTPEDVAQEPIPEAFEFQKLLAQHEADAHRDIEQAVGGDESLQKMLEEDVIKMKGHLERDVIGIAIGQAEQKFLALRGQFAEEQVAKSDAKILELEAENAKLAQRIQDARNVEVLRAELAELQRRPTREEAARIRREHHEVKMEAMRMQLASIRSRYEAELEFREMRKRMEDTVEEKKVLVERLEDEREKWKEDMAKKVRAIVPGI